MNGSTIMTAKNSWQEGLVMDFAPDNTQANCMTSALNATLITFNGNEMSLQNDMGNARVETAYLPDGYIPVGTCEFGDIIYIASYNPLTNKAQLGCFPSPERNISSDELGETEITIKSSDFLLDVKDETTGEYKLTGQLKQLSKREILYKKNINPGDFYIITYDGDVSNATDYRTDRLELNSSPKLYNIKVVSIDDNGKITPLETNIKWYDTGDNTYFKFKKSDNSEQEIIDIDSYRDKVQSPYNVYQSKVSGKLALLIELETIDSFNSAWYAEECVENDTTKYNIFINGSWESKHANIQPEYLICTKKAGTTESITNYQFKKDKDGVVSGEFILDLDTLESDNSIVKYTITPAMSYGKLDNLAVEHIIDVSKLGRTDLNLKVWKYHKYDNTITLKWGFDNYLTTGKEIKDITFTFYDANGEVGTYTINDYVTYNGEFTTYLYMDVLNTLINNPNGKEHETLIYDYFSEKGITNDYGYLWSNFLYIVKIDVTIGNVSNDATSTSSFYRWLWTNEMFNNYYNDILDYRRLSPSLNLDFDVSYSTHQKDEDDGLIDWVINPTNEVNSVEIDPILYSLQTLNYSKQNNAKLKVYPKLANGYNTFNLNLDYLNNLYVNVELGKGEESRFPQEPEILYYDQPVAGLNSKSLDSNDNEYEITIDSKESYTKHSNTLTTNNNIYYGTN